MSMNLRHCSAALVLAGMGTFGLFWLGPTPLNAGLLAILQLAALLLLWIFSDEN